MEKREPKHKNEKEELILNAAQSRFIAYGYSKVTMDEIAEDIGMGKASLYYYFPTKDDVFREVIKREQSVFISRVRVMLEKRMSVSSKLKDYFRLRMRYSGQIFDLSWHNRQLWPSMKPIFKDLFEKLAKEERHILTRLIEEGKRKGELNVPSPERIAALIMNVLQGLRMRLFYAESGIQLREPPHKEFEKEIQVFIGILLSGMACHPAK
jgi:TetR/AcrR family transcriptional regulator